MTKKLYSLTPEHAEILKTWKDQWIANAFDCSPMTDDDRAKCVEAAEKMYEIAGLKKPIVVIVPSPFVLRFASGFACATWHIRKTGFKPFLSTDAAMNATHAANAATHATDATDAAVIAVNAAMNAAVDATDAATHTAHVAVNATDSATNAATNAAMNATHAAVNATNAAMNAAMNATDAAVNATYAAANATHAAMNATDAATHATHAVNATQAMNATDAATNAAVNATHAAVNAAATAALNAMNAALNATDAARATDAATNATTDKKNLENEFIGVSINAMKKLSYRLNLAEFGLLCARRSYSYYRSGNFASGWLARLSFYRDVAKIDIDWTKYQPWETLGKLSGMRVSHPEFCMISEKPCKLEVDEMFQPHCDTGPYIQWRDGTGIYATHGVVHPAWITEKPEWITLEKIDVEENADIRQVMIFKYGEERYLTDSGAKVVHVDEVEIKGGVDGKIIRALMRDKKGGQFLLTHDGSTDRIATMSVSPTAETCRDAHYSISGFWDEQCVANS